MLSLRELRLSVVKRIRGEKALYATCTYGIFGRELSRAEETRLRDARVAYSRRLPVDDRAGYVAQHLGCGNVISVAAALETLDKYQPEPEESSATVFSLSSSQGRSDWAEVPLVTEVKFCQDQTCAAKLPAVGIHRWTKDCNRVHCESHVVWVECIPGAGTQPGVRKKTAYMYEVVCQKCKRAHRCDRSVVYSERHMERGLNHVYLYNEYDLSPIFEISYKTFMAPNMLKDVMMSTLKQQSTFRGMEEKYNSLHRRFGERDQNGGAHPVLVSHQTLILGWVLFSLATWMQLFTKELGVASIREYDLGGAFGTEEQRRIFFLEKTREGGFFACLLRLHGMRHNRDHHPACGLAITTDGCPALHNVKCVLQGCTVVPRKGFLACQDHDAPHVQFSNASTGRAVYRRDGMPGKITAFQARNDSTKEQWIATWKDEKVTHHKWFDITQLLIFAHLYMQKGDATPVLPNLANIVMSHEDLLKATQERDVESDMRADHKPKEAQTAHGAAPKAKETGGWEGRTMPCGVWVSAKHNKTHHEGNTHVAQQVAEDMEAFANENISYPLTDFFDDACGQLMSRFVMLWRLGQHKTINNTP